MNQYLQNYGLRQLWKIKMLIYRRREYSLCKVTRGRGYSTLYYAFDHSFTKQKKIFIKNCEHIAIIYLLA